MHRQFFNILLKNPDYFKTQCNDLNNLFHFATRKGRITNFEKWSFSKMLPLNSIFKELSNVF